MDVVVDVDPMDVVFGCCCSHKHLSEVGELTLLVPWKATTMVTTTMILIVVAGFDVQLHESGQVSA